MNTLITLFDQDTLLDAILTAELLLHFFVLMVAAVRTADRHLNVVRGCVVDRGLV